MTGSNAPGESARRSAGPGASRRSTNRTAAPKTCECCWNSLAPISGSGGGGGIAILFRARAPRDMHVVTSTDDLNKFHSALRNGQLLNAKQPCGLPGSAIIFHC